MGTMASQITSLTIFLLNRLFRRRSKKTSRLRVIGLCAGNSPVTGEFPTQKASNAENVSVWWRHHANENFDQGPLSHQLPYPRKWAQKQTSSSGHMRKVISTMSGATVLKYLVEAAELFDWNVTQPLVRQEIKWHVSTDRIEWEINWAWFGLTAWHLIYECLNLFWPTQSQVLWLKYNLNVLLASSLRIFQSWFRYGVGPLYTKRTDVLPQDLAKSRSCEIRGWTFPTVLKFDRHLGSSAAEVPVKFQSDTIIITSKLAPSRLHEIWR